MDCAGAVDGAAILLGEISDGRIDLEQAWFWTREWQAKKREAARGRVHRRSGEIIHLCKSLL